MRWEIVTHQKPMSTFLNKNEELGPQILLLKTGNLLQSL